MRQLIGLLYLGTGLICDFVFMLFVGSMVGMTTPIYSASTLLIPPLFAIGPSLLVLTGVTAIVGGSRRGVTCLITSIAVVAGLAWWSVPRIGWRESAWLLLEPAAISYLIASLILVVIKNRWIAALIGVVASAPFFVFGVSSFVRGYLHGTTTFSSTDAWIVAPAILLLFSLISALFARFA
jgi:hypothetical protein